jgi:putative hydrolase of the HAD superfamily
MVIKAIFFDVNGTLTDIRTDEGSDEVYRVVSNLLSYQGIFTGRQKLRALYYEIMEEQKKRAGERHPEFDAVAIFQEIINRLATDYTRSLPGEKLHQLPLLLAETYRAATRQQLKPYPGVEETIRQLHERYPLAVISDGQSAYARAELNAVGLTRYFSPIIVSGDYGYRKPDSRLFANAMAAMNVQASEAVYVGNDMYRDVYGARKVGMKSVFFKSNQGCQEREGVEADYIIYQFPELLNAIRFFEAR